MNSFGKNLALWIIIVLLVMLLFNLFQNTTNRGNQQEMLYSDFLNDVTRHQITSVKIQGNTITGTRTGGSSFTTYTPSNDPDLVKTLRDNNVQIKVSPSEENVPSLFGMLISWFPGLLLIGVWIFFMRQMQGGGGRAMGFGKSRARLLTE